MSADQTAAAHLAEAIDVGCTRDDHDHIEAHRLEVIAERDAQIIAWLEKKAAEEGTRNKDARVRATAIYRMADKLSRGAVRPPLSKGADPLVVSRFDAAIEPAPEEEQLLTVGCIAEDGRPVALLLDAEARAKVAEWLAPASEALASARRALEPGLKADTGTAQPRWRVIVTDSESPTGVAPVCTGDRSDALHMIEDYPGGPQRDEEGVYDCCPWPQFDVYDAALATYLVELLNADAAVSRG